MKEDILQMFIDYFYKHNHTFDDKQEELFRKQITFAREHYNKTDIFLSKYYYRWCVNLNGLVLPHGVFKTLFFDEWEDLSKLWMRNIILNKKGIKK